MKSFKLGDGFLRDIATLHVLTSSLIVESIVHVWISVCVCACIRTPGIPGRLEPFAFWVSGLNSWSPMKHDWPRDHKITYIMKQFTWDQKIQNYSLCLPKNITIPAFCALQRHWTSQLNLVKLKAANKLHMQCGYHKMWWLYFCTRLLIEIISKY